MGKVVVIFDFDRTIIDGDSDNWVITQMGLSRLFDQLYPTLPWNSLMNKMMEELHLRGKTVDDIVECLKQMPLDPRIIAAIKSAHSMGCDLRVVSDANQFYIETILKHHGVLGYFMEVITNPTHVDDGRLRISPYHDSQLSPHGCALCPSNMCKIKFSRIRLHPWIFLREMQWHSGSVKTANLEHSWRQGLIVEDMQAATKEQGKNMFIYLGDGRGDYCPSLRLGEGDHVMPRKNFPLWDRINCNSSLIKAKVHGWSNGEELETNLLHIIRDRPEDIILRAPPLNQV